MAGPRRIPAPSMRVVAELIGSLDEERFEFLASELAGRDALEADEVRCKALGRRLGLDAGYVRAIIALVEFLYERINGDDTQSDEAALNAMLAELVQVGGADVTGRLARLVRRSASLDDYLSVRELKAGFSVQARRFEASVDLRSRFSRDREELDAFIPLVLLRIVGVGVDGEEDTVVYQLDRRRLEALDRTLGTVREQLRQVAGDSRLQGLVRE